MERDQGIHRVLKPCARASISEQIGKSRQDIAPILPQLSLLKFRGALDPSTGSGSQGTPGFGGARQLAIHHPYLLALAASGPWPGWAQGAKRGSGTEGIDNKKAAVPWGNFKVPAAEIYVLKRLSQGPEGCSPSRYVSRTYRVPGTALGGVSRTC